MPSLPLWKCGLKFCHTSHLPSYVVSLPLWKCGLKSAITRLVNNNKPSLPLWKCGLKFISYRIYRPLGSVTSLVEVWIEILYVLEYFGGAVGSLPLWKCGLKCLCRMLRLQYLPSLPLWKCGLKYTKSRFPSLS